MGQRIRPGQEVSLLQNRLRCIAFPENIFRRGPSRKLPPCQEKSAPASVFMSHSSSTLHLHGIVEQIPQVITLASTAHTSTLRTKAGVFSVHQIAPAFFDGFDWYKGEGNFLIAEAEKALVDILYLSSRKKKQFGSFPELDFPSEFSFKKAARWVERIPEKKIRLYVLEKLKTLEKQVKSKRG